MLRRGPGLQDTAPFRLPQNLLMSFLLSLCTTGASPGASVAQAASSEAFASAAVGRGPASHATGLPSKQSTTGLR